MGVLGRGLRIPLPYLHSSTIFKNSSLVHNFLELEFATAVVNIVVKTIKEVMEAQWSDLETYREGRQRMALVFLCFTPSALCHHHPRAVPEPAGSASPGNVLEMQAPRPHSWGTESETVGGWPSNLCFNRPSGRVWRPVKHENYWPMALLPTHTPTPTQADLSAGWIPRDIRKWLSLGQPQGSCFIYTCIPRSSTLTIHD